MVYICPVCGKEYKQRASFAKHCKEKHGIERPFEHLAGSAGPSPQPEPFSVKPPEVEAPKKVPTLKKEKKKEGGKRMEEEAKYECANCGYKFNKRYKHCPNCGARFDWSQVEE